MGLKQLSTLRVLTKITEKFATILLFQVNTRTDELHSTIVFFMVEQKSSGRKLIK